MIHERARLSVLTSLITHPKGLTFGDLKQLCALTDGNLSRHLSVLEKGKIIEIVKGIDRNRPQTVCRITASGRKRYLEYLETLEQEAVPMSEQAAGSPAGFRAPDPAVLNVIWLATPGLIGRLCSVGRRVRQ